MKLLLNKWLVIAVIAFFVLAGSTIAEQARTIPGAMATARNDFDARQATAAQDYVRKLLELHRAYQAKLDAALKAAIRDARLDDANVINNDKHVIAKEIEALEHDPVLNGDRSRSGLTVVAARWGEGTHWDDVTSLVRGKIKGNRVEVTDHEAEAIHDPSYGVRKAFEIQVSRLGETITVRGDDTVVIDISSPSTNDQPTR